VTKDETFDVVVVGGGLGGSSAASVLARAGSEVLVLERETAFRDRVRGEWLAPWGILELEALSLRHVADSVPHVNVITRHVGYDESISPEDAEQATVDIAALIPGGGCLAVGHPQFQEALLANAATEGASVRRGVASVRVAPGPAPSVTYEHDGEVRTATCRVVVAADGRESATRKTLGIELTSTTANVNMAGMLVDGTHDWPCEQQAIGVEGDFNYLIFPQADGRVRLYGAWDANEPHRFSGPGRERRFLESFRLACFPVAGAMADGTPAGPLAGYPMTDTWTDDVAVDGVVLVGDAAGWSDPIIGQGMSVAFRDVHMVTDALTSGSDWSADAFTPYAQERQERMRRLRRASAGSYLINGFGEEAIAKRRRLMAMFAENPFASPVATALLGAWVLPEEAYSDTAWNALVDA
jgi:2-polyprenyl-6-methoxyphenol hydroxylase-like FAD-dependent oxidoreductase